MRIGKIAVIIIGLVPFNVYGEGTPTPDCASIGYTETSCETDYLACPFDSTKLKCIPCDSSFRYDCSGDNITGSTGSACNGKYAGCECKTNYVFYNGSCVCDTSCKVGAIYYSDGTCSACVVSGKTAIGIVVKDNELVMTKILTSISWSSSYTNVSGITETKDSAVAEQDFNGKANTLAIVETFTSDTVNNNAAIYCNSYTTDSTNAGDWYLPAAGELNSYVSGNYYQGLEATATKLGWDIDLNLWSSSERSGSHAWRVYSVNGSMNYNGKPLNYSVSCFLAL